MAGGPRAARVEGDAGVPRACGEEVCELVAHGHAWCAHACASCRGDKSRTRTKNVEYPRVARNDQGGRDPTRGRQGTNSVATAATSC